MALMNLNQKEIRVPSLQFVAFKRTVVLEPLNANSLNNGLPYVFL
jgi:hypothetical protein